MPPDTPAALVGLSRDAACPPYAIGSTTWPGLAKLNEECGELLQVVGKIMAYPNGGHPDGSDVIARLHEELGDVLGAIHYVIEANPEVREAVVHRRSATKLLRFTDWHKGERDAA